jgi:enterochelin esterase-like enzyme
MSFAAEAHSDVPTLASSHSGIPAYLLEKARKEKEVIFETRTKPQNERRRLPVVPQGIERGEFLKALAELKEQLGQEHVEINDKPLKDGW